MVRLSYLAFALTVAISPIQAAATCKCLPGNSCFPSQQVISAFEKTLSHPLIHPRPVASVCFPHDPSFNQAACDLVKNNWNNGTFRASLPNTLQFINWESIINSTGIEQCDPFGNVQSSTCFQGRVPWGIVNVTTVSDIQNTVKFASEHNLKLTVKNTGHENLGRSFGESSIMLWTHNMQNITFSDTFIPKGAPSNTQGVSTVTIGAGVQWGHLYNVVAQHGKVVVGGIGAGGTVGAGGGWPMGGGHSILSPFYGLGVDNIVEETVVLPNGSHVTANPYTNPDLFWALRGGGGPSFGILTSVTYLTHPAEPITAMFLVSHTTSDVARLQLFNEWVKAHPALIDAGWAGFWPYTGSQFFLTLMALGNPPTNLNANATLQGFYNTISQIPGVVIDLEVTKSYSGFEQWYQDNFINSQNGIGFNYTVGDFSGIPLAVASVLIPRQNFENNTLALAKALTAIDDGRPFLVGGGAVSKVDPDAMAVNPAFRTMLSDLTISLSWNVTTATAQDIQAVEQNVTNLANGIRVVATNAGSYVNEPAIFQPNFQETYWGNHYPRLRAFKEALDPKDLLIVRQGVNSEGWDDEILCKTV
ncbi:FAD-binding domain-containing protein [Tricholoma matsutake]|nr:FAD-binding domain-containing protein [Tricholoma matsutake 945]